MHLLKGLQAILLDIDKAVTIVRKTDVETEVVPNLMIGFGIDEIQAEYVAEIRLRHLNREYILKRTEEISELEKDIIELQSIVDSKSKVKNIIISELQEVAKKYGQPRCSMIVYADEIEEYSEEEDIPDYPVNLFFTKEGYFKKITPLSLRMKRRIPMPAICCSLPTNVRYTKRRQWIFQTPKPACWVIISLQSSAWMKVKMQFIWQSPKNTTAIWFFALKTEKSPR